MIFMILYIIIAASATFVLYVTASKWANFDIKYDFHWPALCGIFWPIAGPIAAAYIAAGWFIDHCEED